MTGSSLAWPMDPDGALLVARDGRVCRAVLVARGHNVTQVDALRPSERRYPTVAVELDTHDLRFVQRLGFTLTAAWHVLVPGGRLLLLLPQAVGLPVDEVREVMLDCGFGPVLTCEGPLATVLIIAARSTEAPPERITDHGGAGPRDSVPPV